MTQNEVSIIKNSVLDSTEAYVEARLAVADFVKTQIGVVVSAEKRSKKWYHTVRCNATQSNPNGIVYNNVMSVNNIHFENSSTVFILAPNAQFSNQFILGKLDNVPYDITAGSIKIGGTEETPNFSVDSSGNVTIRYGSININNGQFQVATNGNVICKNLTANVGGSIGGFKITSDALGDALGSTNCVGMKTGDKLFAWNPNGYTYMTWNGLELVNGQITISMGGSKMTISHSNIYCDDKGSNVVWHSELSDKNYKKNIKELSSDKIKKFFNNIEPSSFIFDKTKDKCKEKDEFIHYGVIAQNLKSSLEQAELSSKGLVKQNKDKIMLVDYQELHGLELAGIKNLYNVIQEQQKQIDELKRSRNGN